MSRRFVRTLLLSASAALIAATLTACNDSPAAPTPQPISGGGGGNPAPPPQPNRNPTISSMSAAPGFGVATLTAFAMTVSATDPDGDAVTFDWDFGDGSRGTGAAFSKTYLAGGVATITVTASDGRGGTATDRRTVTVGSMNGNWVGTVTVNAGQNASASMALQQIAGVVTGTMVLQGFAGRTDPAQPGRIDSNGAFELRMKVDPFTDFTMRGQMDATGARITGGVFGSGFNGQPFTFDKR